MRIASVPDSVAIPSSVAIPFAMALVVSLGAKLMGVMHTVCGCMPKVPRPSLVSVRAHVPMIGVPRSQPVQEREGRRRDDHDGVSVAHEKAKVPPVGTRGPKRVGVSSRDEDIVCADRIPVPVRVGAHVGCHASSARPAALIAVVVSVVIDRLPRKRLLLLFPGGGSLDHFVAQLIVVLNSLRPLVSLTLVAGDHALRQVREPRADFSRFALIGLADLDGKLEVLGQNAQQRRFGGDAF